MTREEAMSLVKHLTDLRVMPFARRALRDGRCCQQYQKPSS